MKNLFKFAVPTILVAAAAFSGAASAAMTTLQVGGYDTYLDRANINSGDASEVAWVNSVLWAEGLLATNLSVTLEDKDNSGLDNWTETSDAAGSYYYDFGATTTDQPDYYLVKFGIPANGPNSVNQFSHYLFENEASLQYALVDFTDPNIFSSFVVSRISLSHTTTFNGTPVSEPSILGLMGLGMIGLGLSRRRLAISK